MINLSQSSISHQRIALPRLTNHEVCNPSILIKANKLFAVYKGVNFNLKVDGYSKMKYGGFQVPFSDSQNYFANINWDEGLKLESYGFLEDRHIRGNQLALNGLQDIRIFYWQKEIYALAVAITHSPSDQNQRPIKSNAMLLCKLLNRTLVPICRLPSRQQYEKNWMPWVIEDNLHFIYHSDPYEIFTFNGKNIINKIKPESHSGLKLQSGGSTVIPFGKNFIGITHQKNEGTVSDNRKGLPLMSYYHKAIIYSSNFEVLDVSPNFTFEGERVEFCCGIALEKNNLAFSYGIWDTEAIIVKMKLNEFLATLSLDKWI